MTKTTMINEMVNNNYIVSTQTNEELKKYLNRKYLKEQIEEKYNKYLTWKEGKWKLPFFY